MLRFNNREIKDLIKSWILISVAFTILLSLEDIYSLKPTWGLLLNFVIALLTAGLGFLLHELGHKFMAQKYKCHAEFFSDNMMLGLAVLMSFFGFIFAAPGAVHIRGTINRKENGIISAAGPLMNIFLALAFIPGIFLFKGLIGNFFFYGFLINSWLALFNMIPFGLFDGAKIYAWDKTIYAIMVLTSLAFVTFGLFF